MMMDALFIWIPKTAGTSVQRSLPMRRFIGNYKAMGKFNNEGFATFGHASIPYLIKGGIVDQDWYDSAYKFCFVRNPFDRAVSLYHHFLERKKIKKGFKKFCRKMLHNADVIGPYNYRGFSQARPQSEWIPSDIDFIGRLEHLQRDVNIITDRLELPRVKVGRANTSKRKKTSAYYDEETEQIVSFIYEDDFKMLNYERKVI